MEFQPIFRRLLKIFPPSLPDNITTLGLSPFFSPISHESFKYFAHAGMPAMLKNYDPEKDALPAYDVLTKAVEEAFKKETKEDGIFYKVGAFNENEKLAIDRWRVYGHLLAQFNMSPALPYGKWLLKHASDLTRKTKNEKKALLDGFYYDGLPMGTNYRKEHFKYANYPCLWNPVIKKPFLYNFFSSCEFAKAIAEQLRPNGQYTMLNGFADNFFIDPWIDVLGSEPRLNINEDNLAYIKAKFYQKPLVAILKGDFERELKHYEIELFMKRCMAYGIIPGYFDWPPSGLGPGGRYWEHPAYYERDRDLFRKYLPLCIKLAKEGWQPVTYVKSSNPAIQVERFGKGNIFWFTVQNISSKKQDTEFTLSLKDLGFSSADKITIFEILNAKPVLFTKHQDNIIKLRYQIPPDEILLFQAGKSQVVFEWWAEEAVNIIDRGIQMREIDKDKPSRLVHWLNNYFMWEDVDKVYRYNTDKSGNRTPLLTGGYGLRQWVMLFQKNTEELTLKIRARATNMETDEKSTGIECRQASVTSQFTYYDNQFYSIPSGTYDWKDFEFKINPLKTLRSIDLRLLMNKEAKGKLEIAEISLKNKRGIEYIRDPNFREWYERQPDILKTKIENNIESLKDKIKNLSSDNSNIEKLFDIYNLCDKTINEIKSAGIENGCRRVLRDIASVKSCLNYCMIMSTGINISQISGPLEASPGSSVSITFPVVSPENNGFKVVRTVEDKEIPDDSSTYKMTIPPNTAIGSVLSVNGVFKITSKGGEVNFPSSHKIRIVPVFSPSLANKHVNCAKSEYVILLDLVNNCDLAKNVELSVAPIEKITFNFLRKLKLSPYEKTSIKIFLNYEKLENIRNFSVRIKSASDNYSKELCVPILIIPNKINLIKNCDFENGLNYWKKNDTNSSVITENGQNILQIKNDTITSSSVQQSVLLNQKNPAAFYIKASSKGIKISGLKNKGYSLYADIYFKDGSKSCGRTYDFKAGSSDWEEGIMYIEPQKPVKSVTVSLCLRKKSGSALFDNIILAEDSARKNNITHEAKISVDSSFGEKYNVKPINDNRIRTENLAWYEHSWCSMDNTSEHYVDFDFDKPVKIGKVNIFWSLEGKEPMTSREIFFQTWDNGAWKTVKKVYIEKPEASSEIHLTEPVLSNKFRLLQPSEKGPAERPGVIWLREVELIEY